MLESSFLKVLAFSSIFTHYSLILTCLSDAESTTKDGAALQGHLQPIFSHGVRHRVEVLQGFPSAQEFYTKFVTSAKPVLFEEGAKFSPAFKLWTDEYFLSFPEGREFEVTAEQEKKENRTFPAEDIPFSTFVKKYTEENIYMVNSVPDFLRQDILLPPCIACPDVTNGNLVYDIMWFSSGGTKSVLHNDHAENIICVLRGTKEFFLVDKKHMEYLNVTEKGYSDVDVERVDLLKYPGLYNLEHWHVTIKTGDCLYVPLLWVHQVNSVDSNIAVNIWWKNNLTVDFSSCNPSARISFKDVEFVGFGKLYEAHYKMIKSRISHGIRRTGALTLDDLVALFQGQSDIVEPGTEFSDDVKQVLKKVFTMLDQYPADNVVTMEDVDKLNDTDWEEIRQLLDQMMNALADEAERKEVQDDESTDFTAANRDEL